MDKNLLTDMVFSFENIYRCRRVNDQTVPRQSCYKLPILEAVALLGIDRNKSYTRDELRNQHQLRLYDMAAHFGDDLNGFRTAKAILKCASQLLVFLAMGYNLESASINENLFYQEAKMKKLTSVVKIDPKEREKFEKDDLYYVARYQYDPNFNPPKQTKARPEISGLIEMDVFMRTFLGQSERGFFKEPEVSREERIIRGTALIRKAFGFVESPSKTVIEEVHDDEESNPAKLNI